MIRYRPFLNTDPPLLAEIWRSQPPLRGLAQGVSSSVLEHHVFSKTYFDRHGLIVAEEDGRVIGYVHAGFGPTADQKSLDNSIGVVSRLFVMPVAEREAIADELLRRGEEYLKTAGAKRIIALGYPPYQPFYLGLYGGSRLPGVLVGDQFADELFRRGGYEEVGRGKVMQCRLSAFRPPVNRKLMTIRRTYQMQPVVDPIPHTWWDACTLGSTDRTRFDLVPRTGGPPHGQVTFWDMEPISSSWGLHSMGMFDLHIDPSYRRQGLATFLIGESLRQLASQGITMVEIQTRIDDAPTMALCHSLGFSEVDEGIWLEKVIQ